MEVKVHRAIQKAHPAHEPKAQRMPHPEQHQQRLSGSMKPRLAATKARAA
jgi:hypothetical protein